MVKIKRVYDPPSHTDGRRLLVDRLWPRGLKKEGSRIDEWIKDVAPSTELRSWFSHDPGKWIEFKKRFFKELDRKKDLIDRIASAARKGTITLLYGSKEERYNNAVALKEYVEARMKGSEKKDAA
jgi:uncharacterized protein YeaO (DUF488 family)